MLAVMGGWQGNTIQLLRVFRSLLTCPRAQKNGWTAGQMYDCRVTLVLWNSVVTVLWWSKPHSHHHVCMWVTASQANVIKWVHIWLCLLRRQCRYWDAEGDKWRSLRRRERNEESGRLWVRVRNVKYQRHIYVRATEYFLLYSFLFILCWVFSHKGKWA